MLCTVARKLSQKLARLEGSTSSMAASVDAKRPYEQEERRLLDLVSEMGGRRCRCLPLSKICCGLNNGGTVGECLGGVGGGMVEMLM